jgi:hypothetical protein
LERELNETMRCCERLQEREAACEMQVAAMLHGCEAGGGSCGALQGVQLRDAAAAAEASRELDVTRWKTRCQVRRREHFYCILCCFACCVLCECIVMGAQELTKELEEEVHADRQRVEHMSRSHDQQLKELQQVLLLCQCVFCPPPPLP